MWPFFASWVNESGGICERLLACGVQDLPEDPDDAEDFHIYHQIHLPNLQKWPHNAPCRRSTHQR